MSKRPSDLKSKTLLDFAHLLADEAGRVILPKFRRRIHVDNKLGEHGFDPVTAADRDAERVIARLIKENFPDHGIVGEEFGTTNPDARYRWIIDPIDGTRSFIIGAPTWGTLIGLLDGDRAVLGLMDQPFTGERYWSTPRGAYLRLRGKKASKIKTRACRLDEAVLSTTHPDLFAAGEEVLRFASIKAKVRMTRFGGDCYGYCLLASGFVDLIVEAGLNPYDIVALVPIVEAAGGRVTTWSGGSPYAGGRIVAAGDPKLHAEALELLSGER